MYIGSCFSSKPLGLRLRQPSSQATTSVTQAITGATCTTATIPEAATVTVCEDATTTEMKQAATPTANNSATTAMELVATTTAPESVAVATTTDSSATTNFVCFFFFLGYCITNFVFFFLFSDNEFVTPKTKLAALRMSHWSLEMLCFTGIHCMWLVIQWGEQQRPSEISTLNNNQYWGLITWIVYWIGKQCSVSKWCNRMGRW